MSGAVGGQAPEFVPCAQANVAFAAYLGTVRQTEILGGILMKLQSGALMLTFLLAGCGPADPGPKRGFVPAAAWDGQATGSAWTAATLRALEADGAVLVGTVPTDIDAYCPGYRQAQEPERKAFWVGLLSLVADHESSGNPTAKGGGGRFLGLLQISEPTAAAHGCSGGDALLDGATNLACGVRIMTASVAGDGAIFTDGDKSWLGVARDWVPFRKADLRSDVADWTLRLPYCS